MKQAAIVLLSLLLAACASSPETNSSQASSSIKTTNSSQPSAKTGVIKKDSSISSADIEAGKLATEVQALQEESVYFDFDKYVVKPEYRDVVVLHANFIKAHKNDIVTVEGNADERGSNEYNLALGDRRANAVRNNLELLGISATQIRTTSMGEEKPKLSCHKEKCWKENRRCDFVHKLN